MVHLPVTVLAPSEIPEPLDRLWDRRVLVIGAARSGLAAIELLLREEAFVWVYDDSTQALENIPPEIRNDLKGVVSDPDAMPDRLDLAVISPGVPTQSRIFQRLKSANIPWYAELELGVSRCRRPIIAVTGTNGKTTVTTMIDHVLQSSGLASDAAGNVGVPLCKFVLEGRNEGPMPLVLEVSSFQLEASYRFHPNIAVITNLAPDHLDRYNSVKDYYVTKTYIAANQTANDDLWVGPGVCDCLYPVTEAAILMFDDCDHTEEGLAWNGQALIDRRAMWPETYPWPFGETLLRQQRLNCMASIGALVSFGLSIPEIVAHLETYKYKPHRLEYIGDVNGVACYNDSKATNVHAVCAALDSLPGPIRLIAGGQHKGDDLAPLTSRLFGKVAAVYLVGQAAQLFAQAWENIVPVKISRTVPQAVTDALAEAVPGDKLLLSPACTSWDQFPNYEVRGETFREAVMKLKADAGPSGVKGNAS